jgi:uncharacterized membrane protein YdcZ (DUF606 family)
MIHAGTSTDSGKNSALKDAENSASAAQSPAPVFALIAGLCAAVFIVRRSN